MHMHIPRVASRRANSLPAFKYVLIAAFTYVLTLAFAWSLHAEYLERSAAQRAKSAPNRHRKKNKWRERKWGDAKPPSAPSADSAEAAGEAAGEAVQAGCAAVVGAKRTREAPSVAEDTGAGTESKHARASSV